jgi:hypothetical protein
LPSGCAAAIGEVTIGGELFAMDAVNGVITAYTADGESRTVFTASERVQVTADLHDALLRDLPNQPIFTGIPPDTLRNAFQRLLPVGTLLTRWTSIFADPTGRLWLRTLECSGLPAESEDYEIVTVDGEYLGRISIPGTLAVRAVRGDRVLVHRTDELEVEHIDLYRMENVR